MFRQRTIPDNILASMSAANSFVSFRTTFSAAKTSGALAERPLKFIEMPGYACFLTDHELVWYDSSAYQFY